MAIYDLLTLPSGKIERSPTSEGHLMHGSLPSLYLKSTLLFDSQDGDEIGLGSYSILVLSCGDSSAGQIMVRYSKPLKTPSIECP